MCLRHSMHTSLHPFPLFQKVVHNLAAQYHSSPLEVFFGLSLEFGPVTKHHSCKVSNSSSWKPYRTCMMCRTHTIDASLHSFPTVEKLRNPWGRSSTISKKTGLPMSRSFLAKLIESSRSGSNAQP